MKKETPMADKLRSLKKGQSFTVKNEKERQRVNRIVKILKEAGFLPLQIITRRSGDKFTVIAI